MDKKNARKIMRAIANDWRRAETELGNGWVKISYAPVPSYIPKEQTNRYVRAKNMKFEEHKEKTLKAYICTAIIKNVKVEIT